MRLDDPARPRDPLVPGKPALILAGGHLAPMPSLHMTWDADKWRVRVYVLVGLRSFRHYEAIVQDGPQLLIEFLADPERTLREYLGCNLEYDKPVAPAPRGLDINPEDLGL